MDISVLYIIPNDRIIETVQRVMQRCDVNYPVYYGTMAILTWSFRPRLA